MGWTEIFTNKPFSDVIKDDALRSYEIIDLEEVKERPRDGEKEFSVFYGAMRVPDIRDVVGIVVLIKAYEDQGKREVMWKEMDESVGPNYYGCPKRILDKLTPIDKLYYAGYAKEWREKCLHNNK